MEEKRNLPEDPVRASKIVRAVGMRLDSVPYRVIADELGVSIATITKWISKYMREYVPVEDLDALRAKEADILDRMELACVTLLKQMAQANENAAADPDFTGLRYGPDDVMKVHDRMLRIQERRTRLLGLDSATKIEATIALTAIDPEVEALVSELLGGGPLMSDPRDIDHIAG